MERDTLRSGRFVLQFFGDAFPVGMGVSPLLSNIWSGQKPADTGGFSIDEDTSARRATLAKLSTSRLLQGQGSLC